MKINKTIKGTTQVGRWLGVVALASWLTACGGGGDSEVSQENNKAHQLATLISSGGVTHQVIKVNYSKNYVVLQNMQTGEFVAYNFDKYNPATMKTASDYLNVLMDGDVVHNLQKRDYTYQAQETRYKTETYRELETFTKTVYGYHYGYDYDCGCYRYHYGYYKDTYQDWVTKEIRTPYTVWVTRTDTFYQNGDFSFDTTDEAPKDLETVGGLMAQANVDQLAGYIGEHYGLSTSRSSEVARLLVDFEQVKNSRGVTADDLQALQSDLMGTDLATVMAAKKKAANGDAQDLNNLVDHAAQLNDISPEQMGSILNQFM